MSRRKKFRWRPVSKRAYQAFKSGQSFFDRKRRPGRTDAEKGFRFSREEIEQYERDNPDIFQAALNAKRIQDRKDAVAEVRSAIATAEIKRRRDLSDRLPPDKRCSYVAPKPPKR